MTDHSEIGEDLKDLAFSLGYSWPDDDAGRWRVLKSIAKMAAYWRQEKERYSSETLREVERQKLYAHQRQRIISQARKIKNLRKALKEFMTFQVAWLREHKAGESKISE